MSEYKQSIQAWVHQITQEDMPVFGSTIQSIINLTQSSDSTIPELTQIILQDSVMTSRVLKLVNTVFYNPNVKSISTVSRALVLLGMDTVSNICLTIKLVDSLAGGICADRLIDEMSLSIHAAVQARTIAQQRGDKDPEEVFIAALLMRLGRMAFWCYGDGAARSLNKALKLPNVDSEKEEVAILGFTLQALTKALAQEWGLGDLVSHALKPSRQKSNFRTQTVVISNKFAEVIMKNGWKSEATHQVIEELASFLEQPIETVSSFLQDGARDAVLIASSYGARTAALTIPMPPKYDKGFELDCQDESRIFANENLQSGDPIIQLDILREIKGVIYESPSFNTLLEMIMEGIYRGIGMDRTLFALLASNRKSMKAKYVLGMENETLMSQFEFNLDPIEPNIFMYAMEKKYPIRAKSDKSYELSHLITSSITKVIGQGEFLVAALSINNKVIGIIYADRIPSGRKLTEDVLKSFGHFCAEANMGLAFIAQQDTKPKR